MHTPVNDHRVPIWRYLRAIASGAIQSKVPLLRYSLTKALGAIAADVRQPSEDNKHDRFVRPAIPEIIIRKIKEHYEKSGKMMPDRKEST